MMVVEEAAGLMILAWEVEVVVQMTKALVEEAEDLLKSPALAVEAVGQKRMAAGE